MRNLVNRRAGAEKLVVDPLALSSGFHERLSTLVSAAEEHGPVVLITFSHEFRRDQPPEVQRAAAVSSLYGTPFLEVETLLACFEQFNRVIREVARDSGAILVEGEYTIPGDDEHFADSVHFRDPGFRLQAARVLAALLQAPEYRALLEAKRHAAAHR